jgi:transposase
MEPKQSKQKRKRRNFTQEFKDGAVRLVLEEGKTVAEVSRDLDVQPSVVGNWVKRAKIDSGKGPPGALTTAEREELARLKKENRELRMERELLKKAAAFFAKENA